MRVLDALRARALSPDAALSGLVAIAFVTLMPTAALDGRVSVLELSAVLMVAALITTRGLRSEAPVGVPTPLLALLVLMLSSALWSNDSWSTLRDVVSYILLAAFALIVVRHGGLRAVVNGMVIGIVLVLVASFAVLILDPAGALYYGTSGFQGVYANRNTMGFVLVQALPAVLALRATKARAVVAKVLLIVVVLAATGATLSRTALIVAAGIVILWFVLRLAPRSRFVIPAAAIGAVVVAVLVALNAERVLDLLGKSSSLNGRAQIWEAIIRVLPDSPVIGFGWSRSWPPGSPHSEAVAAQLDGQVVFHAHNDLLNWLVTLGVIGAALVILLFAFGVWAGLLLARRSTMPVHAWPLLMVVGTMARGVTEISETNALGWLGLMLALFALTQYLPELLSRSMPSFVVLPVKPRARDAIDRLEVSVGLAPEAIKNGGPGV